MKFCKDCARTRNDISHFGGMRQEGDYGDFITNLHCKSEALSYLYHTLLLHEIGVDGAVLRRRTMEGYQSSWIKMVLADVGVLPAVLADPGTAR
jgi:hypothetical protein